ncbi:zf-U1-domain-containing protein [Tilletiopsis washingtonensis]|uniref:Zf-U1-domain-containing protein n=1 Tax=Tilletiopsis washingtonensis TaxID=58919 RepID=A0A316Z2M5_9BASI|nr:zf-U1-domain-containing protein [Tilletiopsis washingtonensis]PWN95819.1 zf-U1-domain-containing protein [Tilletiopsis washingtonensis]
MGRHYCDYCDILLTHDSTSVRKAHNSGRNHLQNVRDHFMNLDPAVCNEIVAGVAAQYEREGKQKPPALMQGGPGFGPGGMGGGGFGGYPGGGMTFGQGPMSGGECAHRGVAGGLQRERGSWRCGARRAGATRDAKRRMGRAGSGAARKRLQRASVGSRTQPHCEACCCAAESSRRTRLPAGC